jgi:hypothetical protein
MNYEGREEREGAWTISLGGAVEKGPSVEIANGNANVASISRD